MGHHSSDSDKNDNKNSSGQERPDHPFLEPNDLTYLSMIRPLLSPMGQKIIHFFVTLGEPNSALPSAPALDLSNIIKQLAPKGGGSSSIAELLPAMLQMASNGDNQGKINPAMISALMSMLNNKKED